MNIHQKTLFIVIGLTTNTHPRMLSFVQSIKMRLVLVGWPSNTELKSKVKWKQHMNYTVQLKVVFETSCTVL